MTVNELSLVGCFYLEPIILSDKYREASYIMYQYLHAVSMAVKFL